MPKVDDDMSDDGSSYAGTSIENVNREMNGYRDFSLYLQENGNQVERHKKAEANFPAKLHRMLSDPQFSDSILWMPHGRAWKIVDKKSLMTIVPKYFAMKKFRSFVRQLSGWGFRRIRRQGADYGCYYHECFLRGIPLLTWLMRRTRPNEGNPTIVVQSIEEEPNFYDMPLPPSLCHSSDVAAKSTEVVGNYLSAKEHGLSRRASAPTFSGSSSLADSKSCPTALLRLHSYEQRDFVQHHHSVPRVLAEEFIPKRASTTSSVPLSVSHPHSTFSDFIESNSALPSDQGFSPQSSMVDGMRMRQREIYQSSSYRIENEIGAQNNKYIGTEPNTQLPSGKGSPLVYCSSVAAEAAAAAAAALSSPTFQNLLQPTRAFNVRCPFDYERKLSFSEKHYTMTPSDSVYQTNRFSETQFLTAKTSAQEDQTVMQFCQICDTEQSLNDQSTKSAESS